jgi:hypothetical protein
MDIMFVLVIICAIMAIFGIYRAIMNRREDRKATEGRIGADAATRTPHDIVKRQPRWISSTELTHLISSDPDLVVFHLQDGEGMKGLTRLLRGEIVVTLEQLEADLRWIPLGSRIAIYRIGGIDRYLIRRLSKITNGRETFLLSSPAPNMTEDFNQMASGTLATNYIVD